MAKYITKSSGKKELFNVKKFTRSLLRAGASQDLAKKLAKDILKQENLKTTYNIYRYALTQLGKESRPVAARYNLKNALVQLGPSGFPFEKFVAQLFNYQGYQTSVGQFVEGYCVGHEIDVVAQKDNKHFMVEVKFHNRHGLKSDVKVALYVQARFQDIKKKWELDHSQDFHQPWLVTNTRFTSEAIKYGSCVGMQFLSWSYPEKNNLADLIHAAGLHPITCLTTLSGKQKKELIKKGFVLCKDVSKHKKHLKELGLSDYKINQVTQEAEGVCAL